MNAGRRCQEFQSVLYTGSGSRSASHILKKIMTYFDSLIYVVNIDIDDMFEPLIIMPPSYFCFSAEIIHFYRVNDISLSYCLFK